MNRYQSKTKPELITEIFRLKKQISQLEADRMKFSKLETVENQCRDLRTINELNSAIIQNQPLREILKLFSSLMITNFQTNGAAVYLLRKDTDTLEMQPHTIPPRVIEIVEHLLSIQIPRVIIRRSPQSIYFNTLLSEKPLIVNDSLQIRQLMTELTDNKALRKIVAKIQKAVGINQVVIFPLTTGKTTLGILDISRKKPFSKQEIERLETIVPQVTEAILFHQTIKEKESLLTELQNAHSKMKKLSGLIPICSHCKKIRDDSGYWNQVEKYISEHSDAVFSHGICPDCMQKYYPEFVAKKNREKA